MTQSTTTRSSDLSLNARDHILKLRTMLNEQIIGQKDLVDHLLIALLSDGHLLVEGPPGLAKTKTIRCIAAGLEGSFHRIQFTPDLLPSDLTGTDIYRPEKGTFEFQPGPIFHNIILADEINRAPAKVQSALLEAMAERQTTIGQNSYVLPELFLVMATQNPIEQAGTYALPEAQLDRFLMSVRVNYPEAASEQSILKLARLEAYSGKPCFKMPRISQKTLFDARQQLFGLHINTALESYLIQLVMATRKATQFDDTLNRWIDYGASPRATIALDRCARAHAWLQGRDFLKPEDLHQVVHQVLQHRIVLSFTAEADGITPQHIIDEILNRVPLIS